MSSEPNESRGPLNVDDVATRLAEARAAWVAEPCPKTRAALWEARKEASDLPALVEARSQARLEVRGLLPGTAGMPPVSRISWWETIRARLDAGEVPPREMIRAGLREDGVPQELGIEMDRILFGARGAGRPAQSREERARVTRETVDLATRVRLLQVVYRGQGVRGPRDRALEHVARRRCSVSTLKKRIQTLDPRAKSLIPTLKEAECWTSDLVEAGIVRLTEEGPVCLEFELTEGVTAPKPLDRLAFAQNGEVKFQVCLEVGEERTLDCGCHHRRYRHENGTVRWATWLCSDHDSTTEPYMGLLDLDKPGRPRPFTEYGPRLGNS